jgi:hypothetical protein
MTNSHKTILDVSPSGPRHVIARFRRRGRGSRNWQFIVDGFAEVLARARMRRGREWTVPQGGRSLGRGLPLKIGRHVYRAARAEFVVIDEVADALDDGTFVIEDNWLFSENRGVGESEEDGS